MCIPLAMGCAPTATAGFPTAALPILEAVKKVGRGCVAVDFGAGQGASEAPISKEISAKRATQASA